MIPRKLLQFPESILTRAAHMVQGKPSYICPFCGNGSGASGTGICSQDGIHWKCFVCGFYGDLIDIVRRRDNSTTTEAIETLKRAVSTASNGALGVNIYPCKKPAKSRNQSEIEAFIRRYCPSENNSYLNSRGISSEVARRLWFGWIPEREAVVIPTGRQEHLDYILRYTRADSKQRYHIPAGYRFGFFNEKALYDSSTLFICEGAIDAASLIELGYNAIGLNSTANASRLSEMLTPSAGRRFVLCLDNDDAGRKATDIIAGKAPAAVLQIPTEYHDINEWLVSDREGLEKNIQSIT